MKLHCTRCQIALAPGSERCPQCLRTSTLVDRDAQARRPDLFDEAPGEPHVGMRLVVLLAAWTLAGLVSWVALPHQAWLEPRRLWLPVLVWTGALWLLPLRAAFRAPKSEEGPRDALRSLALFTAQLVGAGSVFALVIAGLCQITGSDLVALVVGLGLFIAAIVVAPAVALGLRGEKPFAEVLPPALGKVAVAWVCVGVLMAIAVFRGERQREERTVVIPTAPAVLNDIADAQNVSVTSARAGSVLNLRADGGTFDRTLLRLKSAALGAMTDLKNEPGVTIKLWFPARFESANGKQARDEIKALSEAIAQGSGGPGPALDVAFGDPR